MKNRTRGRPIIVHMCWECGTEKKCATLAKEQAYATKKWVDKNNGVVFWFQAIEN